MNRIVAVEQRIREILVRDLEIDPSLVDGVDSSTPLLGRGIGLDSMETLTLVTGLEQEFGIQIDDDELTTALFRTVGVLAEFVLEKLGAK